MEEKLSGIVLGGVNYGENDKILNVFTLEQGVVSAKIKGVKKAGAKLKFVAEPFCFAEIVFSKKGKMRTVINASLIDSFYSLRLDLKKYFCAGSVVEYVKKFIQEGIISSELFVLTVNTLKNLAYGDLAPQGVLLDFFIKALTLSGYALKSDGCFTCNKDFEGKVCFDYVYGGFFCLECKTPDCKEINRQTYLTIRDCANGQIPDDQSAVKPLRLIDYYLNLKADVSLKSLKELLAITI